jgi:hypothetical protein
MKVYDYKCQLCGHTEERYVQDWEAEQTQWHRCPGRDGEVQAMVRLPPGTRTHFRFADTKLKR